MRYKVCFPAMGIFDTVTVNASSRRDAIEKGAKKRGLLKPGMPKVYVMVAGSVENLDRKKPGRKGWIPEID